MTTAIVLHSGAELEATPSLAFDDVRAEMAALQPRELLVVNRDVQQLVSTGLGVLPIWANLRERAVVTFPAADVGLVDRLETYALALAWAQTHFLLAVRPDDGLDAVVELGTKARAILKKDAEALAQRGLINGVALRGLKGGKGRNALSSDLGALSWLLDRHWDKIEGKSAVTRDELELASKIATRLERVMGRRQHVPEVIAEATDTRRRVFTLFMRAYAEARLISQYLNRKPYNPHLDIPSLYARQRHRKTPPQPPRTPANADGVTETGRSGD